MNMTSFTLSKSSFDRNLFANVYSTACIFTRSGQGRVPDSVIRRFAVRIRSF